MATPVKGAEAMADCGAGLSAARAWRAVVPCSAGGCIVLLSEIVVVPPTEAVSAAPCGSGAAMLRNEGDPPDPFPFGRSLCKPGRSVPRRTLREG